MKGKDKERSGEEEILKNKKQIMKVEEIIIWMILKKKR